MHNVNSRNLEEKRRFFKNYVILSVKVSISNMGIIRVWVLFEGGSYMRKYGISNLILTACVAGSLQKSIWKLIFAGYTSSKNPVPNKLRIQFVELDFSSLIFQKK